MKIGWRWASIALVVSLSATPSARAQQPTGQRIVGVVEKIDGAKMLVKTKNAELTITLANDAEVTGLEKASLPDIKVGEFIGSGAIPQPDGTQKAAEVHIFAEAQRGSGEGHRPWSGAANGSMTNGTVTAAVARVGAGQIVVKYKGGQQTIVVPPGTPIVRFQPGDRSELKPGTRISISRAVKNTDGSFTANRVSVGRGGVVPR